MEIEQAAAADVATTSAVAPADVLVRFTTSITSLRVPSVPINVPTSLTRGGLTKVVQHLLEEDDESMPALEFFVPPGSAPGVTTRKLLRSTLAKHLASLGVSFETTVTLEYAIPVPPPRAGPSSQEDDWVAAIDGGENLVASGSFDGSVTVKRVAAYAPAAGSASSAMAEDDDAAGAGSSSSAAAATSAPALALAVAAAGAEVRAPAHVGAASSVHLVELAGDASAVLATGGHDGTVRLWTVTSSGGSASSSGSATAAAGGRKGSKAAAASSSSSPGNSSLSLRQYAELSGARGPVRCVRLDPTCRLVAAADAAGNVFLWNAPAAAPASAADESAGDAGAGAGAAARPAAKRARTARSRAGSEAAADGSSAGAGAESSPAAASAVADREPVVQLLAAHRGAATGLAWLSEDSFASCGLDGAIRIWEVRLTDVVAGADGDDDSDEESSSDDEEEEEEEDDADAAATKKAAKAKAKAKAKAAAAASAGAGAGAAAAGAAPEKRLECVPLVSLSGGKAAYSLAASPLGSLLASAHADGMVRVWDARGRAAGGAGDAAGAGAGGVDGLRATLAVHATTAKAAAAALADATAAAAAAAGGKKGKAAAATAGAGAGAGAAPSVAGFGARDAESTWVSAVSWCPSSSHHLAVASMSGAVSVWDTRSPSAPLFTLGTHVQAPVAAAGGAGAGAAAPAGAGPAAKALCVTWAGAAEVAEAAEAEGAASSASAAAASLLPQLVLSGGSDKMVRCSAMAAPLA